MRDPQPAPPLTEEEIERLRVDHVPQELDSDLCDCCEEEVPCDAQRLLATLDQERTLRQAAETALAEERLARETAEAHNLLAVPAAGHWHREMQAREQELTDCRADLAACESRLAVAEQWRDFYQSALRRGRTAFDAGDMKEARTAFSCGLVSAPNEQDRARVKEWLATEEGQQVLAEIQLAHPAPPPVEDVRDPMRLLYRLKLSGARRDWSAEHDSRCRLGDWDCVGDAPACPYPLPGWSVWKAWRDGMLAQGREVAPERMDWGTLSAHDKALDAEIEAGILLAVAHPAAPPVEE